MQQRAAHFAALDSLRGLAALVVALHHHLLVFPQLYPYPTQAQGLPALLLYTPLHLLWAGSEAVILFFVLSGFVLSLSAWKGLPWRLVPFIVKRIGRIWVPFMVAVTLAAGAVAWLGREPLPGLSEWFNSIWQAASLRAYGQHALMLGEMDRLNHAFIPVVWSLKWEMWGSLLLPLVISWARLKPCLVGLSAAASILLFWGHSPATDPLTGLTRYLPFFVCGALLARYQLQVSAWVGRQRGPVLLAVALLLFPVAWYGYGNDPFPFALRMALNDLIVLGASGLLIALALGWSSFARWLEKPALLWLGRVSFSLYLYHSLVLSVVLRLAYGSLPLPPLLLLSLALSLVAAHLGYQWVERPAQAWGKKAAARV